MAWTKPLEAAGGVARAAAGTIINHFLKPEAWRLVNKDTNELLEGQYAPSSMSRSAGSNYAEITALNRKSPFVQFLNGKTETLSVESMFLREHFLSRSPLSLVNKLISWTQLQDKTRRPPILTFAIGGGGMFGDAVFSMDVILTDVTDIKYDLHNRLAGIRQVSFTMDFMRYSGLPELTSGEKEVTDTRYARAKDGDYYELLCQQEYGDPMIGVVIAQRYPRQLLLKPGNIVALPALEGVRNRIPQAQSIPLKNAFSRNNSKQRRLLRQAFERRSVPYVSFLYNAPRR